MASRNLAIGGAVAALILAGCGPATDPVDVSGADRIAVAQSATGPVQIADDFTTLCVGECPGSIWHGDQQIEGRVSVLPSAAGRIGVLQAQVGPREDKVPKADVIHRMGPVPAGGSISVAFDMFAPEGTPLNSIHLLDLECARCGVPGNPGIRLYLRRGRLRIDRSKIGEKHAWTDETAARLTTGQWYRIEARVAIGSIETGAATISVDGKKVLEARGRTLLAQNNAHIDRIQFGVTASSNDIPVRMLFDNFSAEIVR